MSRPAAPAAGIEVAPGVRIAEADLRFTFSRSGGPGGQNVNKVSTKATLRVKLDHLQGLTPAARERLAGAPAGRLTSQGQLLITSDLERSQAANRSDCLERLRACLLRAVQEPKPRRPTRPTPSSRRRRLDTKKARGRTKALRRKPLSD
jgi:ribosome-associated protein